MKFSEIVKEAKTLLQGKERISYRALKMEFGLDDEQLDVLKEELIDADRVATDENGKILVWTGDGPTPSHPQSPSTYTPQHLAEGIRAEQQAMESRGVADGERKTITALFADLKGSTALIEGLDPEEARAIIDPALQLMMDAVHRYDGYVAQALGDGIFALFGAPIAHEDHPQRAVHAALRMQEEMRGYADTLREKGHPPLLMRVGLNTGEVVVRSIRKDDLHADYVPVGHSTNLAARMEQLAAPGSILVSEYTHKLTDGYFAFKDMGKTQVKGVDAPLNVYEVTGTGSLQTRLQVSARRGLSRFVGRYNEMEQLQQVLDQATARHGQIVGVMGEPGLGKSRLFREFKAISQSKCLILEAFAVSHGQASPYLPLIELLKAYFQIEPTDDDRQRRAKVMGQVLALDKSLEEPLPYLLALLGIEDQDSSLQQMDAQIRRQRTFDALKKLFLRESLNQPLLLVVEDLHWIDSETQGFLDTLTESVASAPLLLLTNYRPEYRHEWGGKTYYTQLRLAPLGQQDAEALLTFLLGPAPSLTPLKHLILEKTDGTPFFMEEVVQTLVEEGALRGEPGRYTLETTPADLQISPTVQGVLAARIDRLTPDEKALLQQLAVVGRQFPASLVKQVVTQAEGELYQLLSSLQAKEFLYEQLAFPESEYLFKHALTQDVAYGSVLQEQRKDLHERTGHAIETLYTNNLDEHYTTLAHHYQLSGNTEKAVEYLSLAGHLAIQQSANTEAVQHLSAAIELLQTLPNNPERTGQEIGLYTALGNPLAQLHGWGAPEVEAAYAQARILCSQQEQSPLLLPIVRGQWISYIQQNNLPIALDLATQCMQLAEGEQNREYEMWGHTLLGITDYITGELHASLMHFEAGLAIHQTQPKSAVLFSMDPGWAMLADGAVALWVLGYPEQAFVKMQTMQRYVEDFADPYHSVMALVWWAWLYQLEGEGSQAYQWAEDGLRLSSEIGSAQMIAQSVFFRGWSLATQAYEEGQSLGDGIRGMREGLAALQESGAKIFRPHSLVLLAEAYGRAGQVQLGLDTLAQAVQESSLPGKGYYWPEVERIRGELLLQKSQDEAEAYFLAAIESAQKQDAKSWELRATTSLARLWQGQGKTTEARELLAPVYNWFTEGFETADLKDAKALLAALS